MVDDRVKKLVKELVDHFDQEDRAVRDRQIKTWRRLKLLWENIQHTYYSEVAHDWRVPEWEQSSGETDQAYYDKPINIYRAYLESIIAALSITVPPVVCYPDDADNPLDLSTAKAGDKIAELIFRHNNAPLLWLHALFVYVTEGMTACYCYEKSDEKYGTYEEKQYEDELETTITPICQFCGQQAADPSISTTQKDKFDPSDEDVLFNNIADKLVICQNCARQVVPTLQESTATITRLVGRTTHPKSRICMEIFGGLFVKVPVWARNQSECNYLIYSYESHYANVLEQYPELKDKIVGRSSYDLYEQWGRLSPQYRGEYPINNVTVRNCWFRPCAYHILHKDDTKYMQEHYPDGIRACVVNDIVAHVENENLDDSWTLTYNPLSDYIHFDPLGLLLVSIQDITNDLVSLVLQTVEHGIPQTFADPKVLNFNAYRNSEAIPGGIYPATPRSGKPLQEGFYEVKTATLSGEVLPFAEKVQELGQLVSGSLPSLFGGQMSGSRTASEYSMSRAQALQRLQGTWKVLTAWWKEIFGKVIPMYIKTMKDDEHNVKKDDTGNFVNVFIRRAELEGRIGSIELEANENLPITWNQQKDAIMEILDKNNPILIQMLASPENIPYVKKAIGLTDFVVPGEDDRQKQYEEIQMLINSEPIAQPPDPIMIQQAMMMGQPPPPPVEVPSVEADMDLDNHALEADICRRWLISEAGRQCKNDNPNGYKNVLLHMKMHKDIMQFQLMQQQQQQVQMQQSQEPPPGEPAGGEPINEPESVGAIQ